MSPPTRTRVVATLGPATANEEKIAALIEEGVDIFRLNFSHGTHEEHGRNLGMIRRIAGSRPVAVLQDLCGPKLRLKQPVSGKAGDIVEIPLHSTVRAGEPVLLGDGVMRLEVIDARHCKVVVGGSMSAGKGINLPSSHLDIPSLTDKDREDLRFGVEQGVDFVALSFVRRASDLDEVKKSGIPIIAKIEMAEAVRQLEEIVRAAHGVMVARGDLGVEIPIERLPIVQKQIIATANRFGRPVITATQMMLSMVDHEQPTRAEATDVANAVLDGTDAVMLSDETAVGRYPLETVQVMHRIVAEAERLLKPRLDEPGANLADVIAHTACATALRIGAQAIVVPTDSGFTARKIAQYRPNIPILALTRTRKVQCRLSLVWGVTAIPMSWGEQEVDVLAKFRESLGDRLPKGSTVVVTAGWPLGKPGNTNLVHVATI